MDRSARKIEPATLDQPHVAVPTGKKHKIAVWLCTRDDGLWPQIGAQLKTDLLLKQVDSVDELLAAAPPDAPGIVLWDARDHRADAAAVLSRLQLHGSRLAIIALDDSGGAHPGAIAHLTVPIAAADLAAALDSATEEVNARSALLGETKPVSGAPSRPRNNLLLGAAIVGGIAVVCIGAYFLLRHGAAVKPVPAPAAVSPQPPPAKPVAATDEQVDSLIEKAQQAMLERHFIDPADGSALALYRSALLLAPDNGEARQGLQRLAEVLFTRVQSDLDERKFDLALQALETARSIDPNDRRLPALDERIANLRAELGPAQILAAINAQNFDRAAQLIDEAARTKAVSPAKLNQLRDEVRRRREESDTERLVKLIDTRLQQDKLIEPRNDSAAFYLSQAKEAGASAAALQTQYQELLRRLTQSAHSAIDQRRFADADRLLAELHNNGAAAGTMAALQRDLSAMRTQQAQSTAGQQFLEQAQSRLAQGNVTEPENDSALFYLNQLRAADPKSSSLPQLAAAVQVQILERARAALDASQAAKAEALLQSAAGLGASADLNALNDRLLQLKLASAAMPVVPEGTLTRTKKLAIDYPTDALAKGIEGWVDIDFMVTAEGGVAKIQVVDSNPRGIFDSAATRSVSRLRYQPPLQGGKAVPVGTRMRITFRIAK